MRSWVESANVPSSDFPIENLPFGVFRFEGGTRCGIAIGDELVDLRASVESGSLRTLDEPLRSACASADLAALMALGRPATKSLRSAVTSLLSESSQSRDLVLRRRQTVEMTLPCSIGDYTDFYASIHHARNVGSMFRPDNPLLPNYKHVPIGYHGRASSLVVSGTPVRRPSGQTSDNPAGPPQFGPSRRLDYELEVGAFIGRGNALGEPIDIRHSEDHLFGLCLVNDWSARDIQAWEYQPLGPFLGKSFATTISPWIVTLDALEPFRVAPPARAEGDPEPLPYLRSSDDRAFDLQLEVWLRTPGATEAVRISRGNFRDMYWTLGQMVAHHASNGCNLRAGDLIASGTVSGTERGSRGSLLELAWRGAEPLVLPNGEERRFLLDGDEVILRGYGEKDGLRIGFGECGGTILPAK